MAGKSSINNGIQNSEMLLSDSLNEVNLNRWKNECYKLSLTNDEFFELLLMTYSNSNNRRTDNFDKSNTFSNQSNLLLLKLNQQRLKNSLCCDLHFTTPGLEKSVYYSAHTCVLVSHLGEDFYSKLNSIISTQSCDVENKSTLVNKKDVVMMPLGFEQLVEFSYTGKFLPSSNEASNSDELISLITVMVDNEQIKDDMLKELNQIQVVQSSDNCKDVLHFISEHNCMSDTVKNTLGNDVSDNQEFSLINDSDLYTSVDSVGDTEFEIKADDSQYNVEVSTSQLKDSDLSENDFNGVACSECGDEFPTKAHLRKHLKYDHDKTLPVKSTRIKSTIRKNAKRIGRRKNKRKYNKSEHSIGTCCEEDFFNKYELGVHVIQKHSTVYATCSDCKGMVLLNELVGHYQTVHNYGPYMANKSMSTKQNQDEFNHSVENLTEQSVMSESNNQQDFTAQVVTSNTIAFNKTDRNRFDQAYLLSSSWLQQVMCPGCQKQMTASEYIDHLEEQFHSALSMPESKRINVHKTHRCLLYHCQLCQINRTVPQKPIRLYLLLTKHILRYHQADSSGDEKVVCNKCGKLIVKFYLESHMKTHLNENNSVKTAKVPCDVCGKEVSKLRISVHRRMHFEKFSCQYCLKLFNRKANLQVHERIHTGEKPYVCDICGKSFRQNVELRLHNRKHEKEKQQLISEPASYFNQSVVYLPNIAN